MAEAYEPLLEKDTGLLDDPALVGSTKVVALTAVIKFAVFATQSVFSFADNAIKLEMLGLPSAIRAV